MLINLKCGPSFAYQDVYQIITGKKNLKSALHFQQWEISQMNYGITIMIMMMVEKIPMLHEKVGNKIVNKW